MTDKIQPSIVFTYKARDGARTTLTCDIAHKDNANRFMRNWALVGDKREILLDTGIENKTVGNILSIPLTVHHWNDVCAQLYHLNEITYVNFKVHSEYIPGTINEKIPLLLLEGL